VSFGSNKSKAYVVTKVNLNAFANGASISTNLRTSRIDFVDITTLINFHTFRIDLVDIDVDERVEKGFEVKKNKEKVKWELNQSFRIHGL
jgi:hypothetical protein